MIRKYNAVTEAIQNAYPDTLAIYRFGSWGTPYQRVESDLDVAVLLPHDTAVNVNFIEWSKLNGELSFITHTDYVDLVNLQTATTSMQAEVIRTGEVIFCRDDDARAGFEALVLTMHQDLNIQRAGLYQDIAATCKGQ